MANLTGMPISSLPETTLQEGDQVVGYRAETGKAYRTDLADQIADLTEQVNQLNQSLSNYSSESLTLENYCTGYGRQRITRIGNIGFVYLYFNLTTSLSADDIIVNFPDAYKPETNCLNIGLIPLRGNTSTASVDILTNGTIKINSSITSIETGFYMLSYVYKCAD